MYAASAPIIVSRQILSGKNAACRRFHVALHTGHLSGEVQPVLPAEVIVRI